MPISSSIPIATDLEWAQQVAAGTTYAQLITAAPPTTYSTVSDLTLATGGNYALVTLSGVTASSDTTAAKVTATNPTWTGLTTNGAATIKGAAICKRAGASPAGTDRVISIVGLTTEYTPNGADFTINIPTTGYFKTR